jgi:hypothetical protein
MEPDEMNATYTSWPETATAGVRESEGAAISIGAANVVPRSLLRRKYTRSWPNKAFCHNK